MSLNKLNQVFGNKLKIWPMATKAESNKMENGIQANFPFYNQWVVLKQKKKNPRIVIYLLLLLLFIYLLF